MTGDLASSDQVRTCYMESRMSLMPLVVFVLLFSAASAAAQTVTADRFRFNTGACVISSGSGSPEGAVTGVVCSTYYQTNSPYDIWRKTSGTGTNTGWTKVTNGLTSLTGSGVSGSLVQWTTSDTLGTGPVAANVPLLSAINTFATYPRRGEAVWPVNLTT